MFRKAFPEGFHSDFYDHYERNYKKRSIVFMSEKLTKEHLDSLLASGDHEAVCQLAKQALGTSNLVFPNERMALSDALRIKGTAQPFAEGLRELVYGDIEAALKNSLTSYNGMTPQSGRSSLSGHSSVFPIATCS